MMVLLRSFAGQGVVVRIANAPDRLLNAGLGQAFGVHHVLALMSLAIIIFIIAVISSIVFSPS